MKIPSVSTEGNALEISIDSTRDNLWKVTAKASGKLE